MTIHSRLRFAAVVLGGMSLLQVGCNKTENRTTQAPTAVPPVASTPAATEPATQVADAMPAASTLIAEKTKLESIELGAAKPVHQHGRYYLAGQPAEEDFAALKEKGVKTVITLRTAGEVNFDEKAAVEAQGMKFVSIPFRAAESLGDPQIEAALKELADESNGPILLHCGSSNRVGAIWYAHRVRHDGLSTAEALAEAKEVGLRNAGLTDVVSAYCERMEDKK